MIFFALLALVAGGILAVFLGIVGLVEAPWPVLLGLLIVALYGMQRLSDRYTAEVDSPPAAASPATEKQQAPQLMYRGVPYNPKPPTMAAAAPAETGKTITLEGTYRGRHWQKSMPAWPIADPKTDPTTVKPDGGNEPVDR